MTEEELTKQFGPIGSEMRNLYEKHTEILKSYLKDPCNDKMEFPIARKVYAETISKEELDRKLLEEAQSNGFDTYGEYIKHKTFIQSNDMLDFSKFQIKFPE